LKQLEVQKKEQQVFYDLANLEFGDPNDEISSRNGEESSLQRMVRKDDIERKKEMEERYIFVKMEDYKNQNPNAFHNIDTLEYNFHTFSDNLSFKIKNTELKNFNFPMPEGVAEGTSLDSQGNRHNSRSKAIAVDVFQRMKEKPKVTRQRTEEVSKANKSKIFNKSSKIGRLLKRSKKAEPSNKNRK